MPRPLAIATVRGSYNTPVGSISVAMLPSCWLTATSSRLFQSFMSFDLLSIEVLSISLRKQMIMLSVPSRVGIALAMTLLPMIANVAGPGDDEYNVWPVNPSLKRRYKPSQPLLQSLLVALISSGSGPTYRYTKMA